MGVEKKLRDLNSKSRRTKKILLWDFYDPYEEYGKETELKLYFCTFCYAKKPDNIKEGVKRVILYDKSNTSYLRNHVVTAHKRIFRTFFLICMGDQRLWLVMMPPPLGEVWIPLYHVVKFQMMNPF